MNSTFRKPFLVFVLLVVFVTAFSQKASTDFSNQTTMCNPINLSYRFSLDTPSRREAADPTMVVYKGEFTCLPLNPEDIFIQLI